MRSLRSYYYGKRHQVYTARRHLFEAFGSDRFSHAGLDGLDVRLQPYVDFENGFFIEAGANDGFAQSNTYWLERFRGWNGILIEPMPILCERCRRERPRSTVYNYALVADNWRNTHVTMRVAGLMSFVDGALPVAVQAAHEQAAKRLKLLSDKAPCVRVPARSLNAILENHQNLPAIDLLSLDVEGFEKPVLEGFDLARYHPTWLLIETKDPSSLAPLLDPYYSQINQLSYHDFLFRVRIGCL
jgi:FkbM family methyltransferase